MGDGEERVLVQGMEDERRAYLAQEGDSERQQAAKEQQEGGRRRDHLYDALWYSESTDDLTEEQLELLYAQLSGLRETGISGDELYQAIGQSEVVSGMNEEQRISLLRDVGAAQSSSAAVQDVEIGPHVPDPENLLDRGRGPSGGFEQLEDLQGYDAEVAEGGRSLDPFDAQPHVTDPGDLLDRGDDPQDEPLEQMERSEESIRKYGADYGVNRLEIDQTIEKYRAGEISDIDGDLLRRWVVEPGGGMTDEEFQRLKQREAERRMARHADPNDGGPTGTPSTPAPALGGNADAGGQWVSRDDGTVYFQSETTASTPSTLTAEELIDRGEKRERTRQGRLTKNIRDARQDLERAERRIPRLERDLADAEQAGDMDRAEQLTREIGFSTERLEDRRAEYAAFETGPDARFIRLTDLTEKLNAKTLTPAERIEFNEMTRDNQRLVTEAGQDHYQQNAVRPTSLRPVLSASTPAAVSVGASAASEPAPDVATERAVSDDIPAGILELARASGIDMDGIRVHHPGEGSGWGAIRNVYLTADGKVLGHGGGGGYAARVGTINEAVVPLVRELEGVRIFRPQPGSGWGGITVAYLDADGTILATENEDGDAHAREAGREAVAKSLGFETLPGLSVARSPVTSSPAGSVAAPSEYNARDWSHVGDSNVWIFDPDGAAPDRPPTALPQGANPGGQWTYHADRDYWYYEPPEASVEPAAAGPSPSSSAEPGTSDDASLIATHVREFLSGGGVLTSEERLRLVALGVDVPDEGTAPPSNPFAVGTAPMSHPSADDTGPLSNPFAVGTAPMSNPFTPITGGVTPQQPQPGVVDYEQARQTIRDQRSGVSDQLRDARNEAERLSEQLQDYERRYGHTPDNPARKAWDEAFAKVRNLEQQSQNVGFSVNAPSQRRRTWHRPIAGRGPIAGKRLQRRQ